MQTIEEKSFVISCGSGCAMIYTAEQIIKSKPSFKIRFKLEIYVNETLSDTYKETYLFIFDKSFREFSENLIRPLEANKGK